VFYGVRGPRAVRARIPSWFTANYRPARIALRLPGENRPVNDLPGGRRRAISQKSTTQRRVARAFRGTLQAPLVYVLYIRGRSSCRQKGPRAATSGPREPTKLLFLHRGAKMFTALARRRYEALRRWRRRWRRRTMLKPRLVMTELRRAAFSEESHVRASWLPTSDFILRYDGSWHTPRTDERVIE